MKNDATVKILTKKIKQELFRAQRRASNSINKEMLELFWTIGKMLSESRNRKMPEWLAAELEKDFPNNLIFSKSNFEDMRKLFQTYPQISKVQPSVAQIPWAQHRLSLQKTISRKRINLKPRR